jgi:hypothetical protein
MDLIDYYILESKRWVARYRFLMRLSENTICAAPQNRDIDG